MKLLALLPLLSSLLSVEAKGCPHDGEPGSLRVCYYTTWARYRPAPFDMAVEDFDPRMCSHVIIAFAWITEGRLAFHSEYDDKPIFQELVRFKKHYPQLKGGEGIWRALSAAYREASGEVRAMMGA